MNWKKLPHSSTAQVAPCNSPLKFDFQHKIILNSLLIVSYIITLVIVEIMKGKVDFSVT